MTSNDFNKYNVKCYNANFFLKIIFYQDLFRNFLVVHELNIARILETILTFLYLPKFIEARENAVAEEEPCLK